MAFLDDLKKKANQTVQSYAKSAEGQKRLSEYNASNEKKSTSSSVKNAVQKTFQPIVNTASRVLPQNEPNWYKGEKPTQRETLARIYDIGNREPEKRDSLMQMYQAELNNPTSPIYNPYSSATTTSLSKTNLNNTLKAHQEWAELSKELTWWAQHPSRNYSDDEIISRVDWNKYKTLAKMDAGRESGSPLALTEAVGYSKDAMYGVLWAARNPNQSTGDAMLDAVQGVLGRGKQYQPDEKTANRLDPTSAEYNPYAVGSTMDELAYKYGTYEFNQEWLDNNRHLIANPDTNADYGKIYKAVQNTESMNAEAQSFHNDVARLLEAGQPVDVDKIIELGEYDHLKKMRESLKSGQLIDTTAAIDFDPYLLQADADAYLQQVTGDYTTDQYDQMLSDNMGGSYMPDESKQNSEELRKLNTDVTLPEYIPVATDAERKAFRVTANAGYSDVVFTTADMVANGTGTAAQANAAQQKAVHAYANKNLFGAWDALNAEVGFTDVLDEDEQAFLQKYFPEKYAAGELPTMDDFGLLDMAAIDPESGKTSMDVWQEWEMMRGHAESVTADMADRKTAADTARQTVADVMDDLAEVYGEGTDQYNAAVATYEMAYAYTRGVPKVWRAYDAYQDASAEGPFTKEYGDYVLTNQRGSNARDILVLNALIENAEIMGLPEQYVANMRQQVEDLKTQNELINAHKLQENEDYDQQVAAFDSQYQPYKPAWFSKPSHAEVVMHAVYDHEAAIALGAAEKSDTVMLAQAMTPEERDNYKYKFMTEGEESATAYFDALSANLYVRSAEDRSERVQEWAAENEINSAVATIGSVALTPMEALSALSTVVSKVAGNDINPYGLTFLPNQLKGDLRTGTKEGAQKAFGDNKVLYAIYETFYDAMTSAADSGVSAMTGGKYGSLILGLSGFNSAVMDASMRGASDDRALAFGLASAVIESATEHSQIDKMFGAFKAGSTGIRGFLSEVLTGFASEAGEEALSSVLGNISDELIMQSMSNREAAIKQYIAAGLSPEEAEQQANKDILTDVLYSGLVGGISGGLTSTAGYAAGKVLGESEQPSQTEQPAGTPVQRAEAALSTSMQEGVGEVQQTATVAGVLQSFGLSDMEANAAAKNIVGSTNTRVLRKMLSQAEDPVGLIQAIAMGSVSERSRSWDVLHNAMVDSKNAKNVGDQLIAAYNEDVNDQSVMTEYDARVAFDAQADATANIIATSGQVDTSALDKAKEQSTNAQLEMGRAEAEVEASNQAVVEAQNRFNANPGDDKAKQALKEAINLQYKARERSEAAKRNASMAKKNLAKVDADFKAKTEANMIAAREQARAEVQQKQAELEAHKQEAAVAAEAQRDSDNETALEVDDFINTMLQGREVTDEEREQIKRRLAEKKKVVAPNASNETGSGARATFVTQMQKKFGVKIRVMDTTEGGQYLRYNGAYDPKTDSIVIDSKATQSDVIYGVLLHELTHKAERSGTYQEFASTILQIRYKGDDQRLAADIRAKQDSYNKRLKAMQALDSTVDATPLTADQASREIVADLTREILFSDEASIQQLCAEKPSVAKRILETIKNFLNQLRGVNDPAVDQLNRARDLFEQALGESGNRNAKDGRKNSMQYALDPYSETQINNWKNSKNIVLYRDQEQFMQFIEDAVNTPSSGKKIYFGKIDTALAEYLRDATGIWLEGYNCTLRANEIKKVLKGHGDHDAERLHGQVGVKKEDFLRVKEILESPDYASRSEKDYDGKPAVYLIKDYGDHMTTVVAVVSDSHLDLRLQTMYHGAEKKNLAMPRPVQADLFTPEAVHGTVPNDSIGHPEETVKQENNRVQFSLQDSIEETRDLLAVHNLTEENMRNALELGGFAMPSIAVIKAEQGHSKYGPISAVFDKTTIDPKASSANEIYGADAWTPTFPQVQYEADSEAENRIRDKYYELEPKVGNQTARAMYRYATDLEEEMNRHGGVSEIIKKLEGSTDMMQMYLVDNGWEVPEPVKKTIVKHTPKYQAEQYDSLIQKMGEDVMRGFETPEGKKVDDHRRAWMDEHYEALKQAYVEVMADATGLPEENVAALADNKKNVNRMLLDAYNYMKNGSETRKEVTDYEATEKAIRDAVDEIAYKKWLNDLFEGAEKNKGIRNQTDLFTPSGNRRSFSATHWDVTLDNVVRAMRAEEKTGLGMGGRNIEGAAVKQYKSIKDVKADSDRLRTISEEEYERMRKNFSVRFRDIASAYAGKGDPFDAGDVLVEAVTKYQTAEGIYKYISKYTDWYKPTRKIADDLFALVEEMKNAPTGYFEAKPRRAIGFDEVAAMVVPDNLSDDVRTALENAGVTVVEYEAGNEADRLEKMNNHPSVAGYRFSLPSDNLLDELIDSYLAGNAAPAEGESQQNYGSAQRQFTAQTLPNNPNIPQWAVDAIQQNPEAMNYEPDSNREQARRGWQRLQENGYEVEVERLLGLERYAPDDVAEANMIMAMALREDTSDPATFFRLASDYAVKGTTAGQELQARKLFSKMTPNGIRVWVAGKLENQLSEFIRTHQPKKKEIDQKAASVADQIRNLDSSDAMKRLASGEETTIDSSNNRWGVLINEQQQALIDHYKLNDVARPGIFYNRATTKQRMLEAILATPNPLEVTGLGMNLIQRLEFMQNGQAVVTNADLNYIGSRLGEFIGYGGDEGGRDADVAIARAYEAFGNITPASAMEKFRTQRYVNMLLSIPSFTRNIMGNAAQNALNAVSHGGAVLLDKAIASGTGRRTVEFLDAKDRIDGWKAFVEETKNTFRDYFIDKVNAAPNQDKYSTNRRARTFQNPLQEATKDLEAFLMSVGDRNVWKKAFVNSLAEQQKLADQNLLFNDDGTALTHDQMVERAERDANYATFTEDNLVQHVVGDLARRSPVAGDVLSLFVPFTGVPTNIMKRSLQYSPVGFLTAVGRVGYNHMRGQNFDQRAFVNDISRAFTGSALMLAGYMLGAAGMITMGSGDEDEGDKVYDAKTARGDQYTPYFYDPTTDTNVSMSTFAPAGSPLVWGASIGEALKGDENLSQIMLNALFSSTDSILNASYLSGLSDLFGGYGSLTENAIQVGAENLVSQSIPALFTQAANALDPYVRDTKDKDFLTGLLKTTVNRIPGLRNVVLPEKVTVTGETVPTRENRASNFYDPFTRSARNDNAALAEAMRLYEAVGTTDVLPSDAVRGKKNSFSLKIDGVQMSVTLTDAQKAEYRKHYGKLWTEALDILMADPAYSVMTDEEKAGKVKKIMQNALKQAKTDFLLKYGQPAEE